MARKTNFTMNKRVFQALAYLQRIPTIKTKADFLILTVHEGTYGLHHKDCSMGNFTTTDLKKISQFCEPLTGQILLVDVSLPVLSGHIMVTDKHITTFEDGKDSKYVFLHLLGKVKFNTEPVPGPVGVAV